MFVLIDRSAPGRIPSDPASSGGFGRCPTVVVLVRSAERTLDSVAPGLQYGLWCFQSCETNEQHR